MRGLSSWIFSQGKPMRSIAPGAKFSTMTSQAWISLANSSRPLAILGVERDRALVAVQHGEVEAVDARQVAQLAARDVAARPLDLDHVGAEPGQQLGAGRPGLHMGHVQNADAFERFHGSLSSRMWTASRGLLVHGLRLGARRVLVGVDPDVDHGAACRAWRPPRAPAAAPARSRRRRVTSSP